MAVTSPDSFEKDVAPLKLEAIDWACRFAIGPISDADERDFDSWRRSSPAHDDAFRNAAAFMGELRALDLPLDRPEPAGTNDNVVSLPTSGPRINRRAFMTGGAMAASLAAGVIAVRSPLGLWPTLDELMADERTAMGERRTIRPMAGVDIEMNSRSSLSMIDKGVRLIAGEIFVSVEERGTPFQVQADGATVTARAALFNVNSLAGELCVTCLDGAVSTARGGKDMALRKGEAVTWLADGGVRKTGADPAAVTAWRRGLLVFQGTPLSTAIGEINRYFPGRLVLRGSGLAARPVTGVFHVNQIELAVVQIQQLTGVGATRLPGGVVLLG
ncbi:FecR family protein [Sphingomonas laterariae]|uniref:FecR family protein n=1 Tax=Edaphosphingomonas laterariae TaxID=861865 RepID=A0A239GL15_9SPHN|nr:FecR domain-containing protein [Sphingomonas laterariae]SNS69163.1 FecR family protein [Sphingomonas laterariae]